MSKRPSAVRSRPSTGPDTGGATGSDCRYATGLVNCAGAWTLLPSGKLIPAQLARELQHKPLRPAGDCLPGFPACFSQTWIMGDG